MAWNCAEESIPVWCKGWISGGDGKRRSRTKINLALYAPKIVLTEVTSLDLRANTAAEKFPGQ